MRAAKRERWNIGWSAAIILLTLTTPSLAAPVRGSGSPFPVRGIKGLWWEGITKYQQALPWLSAHGMNFLMLCYTSFPASGTDWRADYTPEEMRQLHDLAAEGEKRGVTVCLSFNPGIWSRPPLSYSSEADYQLAWRKVKTVHGTGIRWFALCLDDINKALTPEDKERFGMLQAAQVHFVNRLWADMQTLSPRPHLIFCPSAYTTGEALQHREYTDAIGTGIAPEVDLFWTGPEVCSRSITASDAQRITALYRRKPFVWDNYPVNDMFPWRPLVGPVKNRAADLASAVSGYLANPMRQWSISRIPLATLAEYFRAPGAYDPQRAIAHSIAEFPAPQRPAIRLLVELYGHSFWGEPGFPPEPKGDATALLPRYQRLRVMLSENPALKDVWEDVRPTLEQDIATLQKNAKIASR